MRKFLSGLALVALSTVIVGCGGPPAPKMATVKGKINIDASPLASGKIAFEGTDGTPPIILDIKNGVYEGQVTVGPKTIRIMSYKTVAMPKTGMTGPEYDNQKIEENIIPARYNTESKTVKEIVEGTNEIDLGVTAK